MTSVNFIGAFIRRVVKIFGVEKIYNLKKKMLILIKKIFFWA